MKQTSSLSRLRPTLGVVVLALALAVSGCSIKLISSYDETTDKTVTALQKKTEAHLVALEAVEGLPECKYEKHKQFYDEAKVDVSAIAVRAAAIPKNDITTEQTVLLSSSLDNLEKLHKIACLSKDQIKPLRTQFNSSFTAILKLELAKRRGE
jgi:PBP1b-binding outer membrane lipoprotein LpoB